MQVLPSFENLFSATGYLGEAPQLSSVYGEYFNAYRVFGNSSSPNAWDFAGTSLPTGWTGQGSYSIDNGLTVNPSSESLVETTNAYGPYGVRAIYYGTVPLGATATAQGSFGFLSSNSNIQLGYSYFPSGGYGLTNYNGSVSSAVAGLEYGANYSYGITWSVTSVSAYEGGQTIYENSSVPFVAAPLSVLDQETGISLSLYYTVVMPLIAMPTFTIGTEH